MLTVRAVAALIGCTPQTVRNWIRSGRLPAVRRHGTPGGAWLIAEDDLAAFQEGADGARSAVA